MDCAREISYSWKLSNVDNCEKRRINGENTKKKSQVVGGKSEEL